MATAEETEEFNRDVKTALAEARDHAGKKTKLPVGLILLVLAAEAAGSFGLSVMEICELTGEAAVVFIDEVERLSGKTISRMWRIMAATWFNADGVMRAVQAAARDVQGGGDDTGSLGGWQDVPGTTPQTPDGMPAMVTEHQNLRADLEAHGTQSIIELNLTSGTIMTGSVPSGAEATLVGYGGDWRSSDTSKRNNKAGILGLVQTTKTRDPGELSSFFQSVVEALAKRGLTGLALRVNAFFAESRTAFGTDLAGFCKYLHEYFTRTYRGRGVPVICDTGLVVRFHASTAASAANAAELEELKMTVVLMQREIKAAAGRNNNTRLTEAELKEKREGKKAVVCFNCGGNHLVKNCPVAAEKKKVAAAAREDDDLSTGDAAGSN